MRRGSRRLTMIGGRIAVRDRASTGWLITGSFDSCTVSARLASDCNLPAWLRRPATVGKLVP